MTLRAFRQSVASYVPALVLHQIERDPTPITAARLDSLPSALLFADISGFTALTERLARGGPEGAEQLTTALNDYFGRLVGTLSRHGGDVVKFAGDALMVVWLAEGRADVPEATLRAAACALAVQRELAGYRTPDGHALSLKIALGAGRLFGAHLGGVLDRWEFVLLGPPLREVGHAGGYCEPGAVVLGREAAALVRAHGSSVVMEELGEGVVRLRQLEPPVPSPLEKPALGPQADDALWAYVPGAIRARMHEGQNLWLAELRRITVLFATLPADERTITLEQSQALVSGLQTVLYRYEGSVNKLSVDDKGISMIAVLGMPPLAHEDDPVRGIQVALGMQDVFQELGWQCAIGVATGRAFCGVLGSAERCEYTMIGDVVNLAARLMVAAKGKILSDAATYRAARAQLNFEELEPLRLKGKAEPVPVYRPRGQTLQHTRLRTSTLVGREREKALLAARIDALARGESGVAIVEGEAGIGKSHLLDEAHRTARHQVTVLLGAADAIEKTTPYTAWRGVFMKLLELEGIGELDVRRARVSERLADRPELLRLAPLLDAVVALELQDNDDTRQMTGEVRADNTRDLLTALLQAEATKSPLLVSLEDTHWMDSASWALVRVVARDVSPLLLVLATRPVAARDSHAEHRQLVAAPTTLHLVLDSLSPEHAEQLACQRLGVRALPDEVSTLIRSRAQGNPFFTEELAFSLRDAGLIEVENGECRVAPGANLGAANAIPDTVQGVVTTRIDRLDPTQQLALKVASVIGRVFTFQILRDVFPLADARTRLEEHLDKLRSLDLTNLEAPKPDLSFIFKHIITQEVTYDLMLFSQRRELHKGVAQWYEETHGSDLAAYYPLLAHHWGKAENGAKAMRYYELAGEVALRNFASEEAIEFFGHALRIAGELGGDGERVRCAYLELQLGEAYYALANSAKSEEHLRRALQLMRTPYPHSAGGTIAAILRQALVQTAHRLRPLRVTPVPDQRRAELLESARAHERMTQLMYMNNNTLGTLYGGVRALNAAESAGPSPELARTLANMSVVACTAKLYGLAQVYEKGALATVAELDDAACQSYVLEVTSIYRVGVGDWAKARAGLDPAIAIAERFSDHRRWDECMMTLCLAAFRLADFETCVREFERVLASGVRRDIVQVHCWGLAGLLGTLLTRGPASEHVAQLAALLDYNACAGGLLRSDVIFGHGWQALALWRSGDAERALAATEVVAANTSLREMTSHYMLEGFAAAAEVCVEALERGGAERVVAKRAHFLRKALANFASIYPIGRPPALLWSARLAWHEGRRHAAMQAFERCIRASGEMGMPYEAGRAHHALARGLASDDPLRAAHHDAARAVFERLGATADLARLAAGA